jgi:hypothetical protein
MIHDHKPPLNEALLIHWGKRGMHWGVRHPRPDEAERKRIFGPRAKKYSKDAVNASVSTGAAAVEKTIQASGGTSLGQLALLTTVATIGSAWINNRQNSLTLDLPIDHMQKVLEALEIEEEL